MTHAAKQSQIRELFCIELKVHWIKNDKMIKIPSAKTILAVTMNYRSHAE